MRTERTPEVAAVSGARSTIGAQLDCAPPPGTNLPVETHGQVCFRGRSTTVVPQKRNETAQWASTSESHLVIARLSNQSRLDIIPQQPVNL